MRVKEEERSTVPAIAWFRGVSNSEGWTSSRLECRRWWLYQPTHSTIASSTAAGAPDAVGDEFGLEGVDEALGHRGEAPMSSEVGFGVAEIGVRRGVEPSGEVSHEAAADLLLLLLDVVRGAT